jgi:uncharacterized membrane protein
MAWYYALPVAILGNLLPVPFLLLLLESLKRLLSHHRVFNNFFPRLYNIGTKRGKLINPNKLWGLAILVAIPLPMTGAWTGSLIAVALGLDKLQSFFYIWGGITIAGIIVTLTTLIFTSA